MVDEYAGELLADRLVDQHGRDRAVDAAGEAADDAAPPDLLPDAGDLGLAKAGHGPGACAAGDLVGEVADQGGAVRGVDDLGMEHGAVEATGLVGDDGEGGTLAAGDRAKTLGQADDAVAVAHPDQLAAALCPGALEQGAVAGDVDVGGAELAVLAGSDLPAQLLAHGLLAVADAEHRDAEREDDVGGAWR